MTGKDKNGKQLKTGDIVKIKGGYFKADNGTFLVVHAPGDPTWSGSDYCLKKCNKKGAESESKYSTAFWPLSVTVNNREKRYEAREHNAKHAIIEIIGSAKVYKLNVKQRRGWNTYETKEIATEKRYNELLTNKYTEVEVISENEQQEPVREELQYNAGLGNNHPTPEPITKEEAIKELNAYEQKQEERRQRYLDRAGKAATESTAAYKTARQIGAMIPFGQPILVGHHSEKRHRGDLAKIDNAMQRSIKAQNKAEYYEQKAASVGKGGISSDDPEAIEKLREKLASLERSQEIMKQANAIIRKYKADKEKCLPELVKLGLKETTAAKILEPDFCGRIGFASYSLSNNNANIHNVKERIASLERAAQRQPVQKEFDGFDYCEEDNRAQFIFPGKPDEATRAILKYHSFKWSPTRGAWVRQLTGSGRYAAECVIKKLQEAQ